MPYVSVIVPAYNVSPYLWDCVESVLSQSLQDIEVIIIDDGSTDGTLLVCEKLSEQDERVILIRQENAGVSSARNAGLEIARGEYVLFLDGDDVLSNDCLEKLYSIAIDCSADLCIGGIRRFSDGENPPEKLQNKASYEVLSGQMALEKMLYSNGLDDSPCGLLSKRGHWSDLRFPESMEYEDLYLMPDLYRKSTTVVVVNDWFYGYRMRLGSAMHPQSISEKRLESYSAAIVHVQNMPCTLNTLKKAINCRVCLESGRLVALLDKADASADSVARLKKMHKDLVKSTLLGVLFDISSPVKVKIKCLMLGLAPKLADRLRRMADE